MGLATLAAGVLFPLLVWGGYALLPFDPPLVESGPLRVVYTLRCSFFGIIPILLGKWRKLALTQAIIMRKPKAVNTQIKSGNLEIISNFCRYGGAGCCSATLQRLEAPYRDQTGGQGSGGALALHQRVAGPLPLLLPATRCHGNLRQPGPVEAGAAAHHRVCVRQVRVCTRHHMPFGFDATVVCCFGYLKPYSVSRFSLLHTVLSAHIIFSNAARLNSCFVDG